MIQNQGIGEVDADLRCIGEATLLRERNREMNEEFSKGWPKG